MAKNFVSNKDETAVMFKNPLMEMFTRIHWSVPLFLFVPVVLFFLYKAVFIVHLSIFAIAGLYIGGFVSWTLVEYVLHRFVFHTELPGKIGRRIHFIVHGVHHDYPKDSKRLVMVPSISIPLAFIFYYLFYYTMGAQITPGFFAGFVTGYLFYDMVHYAIHHYNFKSDFWLNIKNNHMLHHYQDSHKGYAVSNTFWDHIFFTTIKKGKDSGASETENSH